MSVTQNPVYQEMIAGYDKRIANIMARQESGYVHQFENGLCMGKDKDGEWIVTGFEYAEIFPDSRSAQAVWFKNGANERTVPRLVMKARAIALHKVEDAKTIMENMAKEADDKAA